jgi:hypothetical protein
MTGPEHYRRAEELAAQAHRLLGQGDGQAHCGNLGRRGPEPRGAGSCRGHRRSKTGLGPLQYSRSSSSTVSGTACAGWPGHWNTTTLRPGRA